MSITIDRNTITITCVDFEDAIKLADAEAQRCGNPSFVINDEFWFYDSEDEIAPYLIIR